MQKSSTHPRIVKTSKNIQKSSKKIQESSKNLKKSKNLQTIPKTFRKPIGDGRIPKSKWPNPFHGTMNEKTKVFSLFLLRPFKFYFTMIKKNALPLKIEGKRKRNTIPDLNPKKFKKKWSVTTNPKIWLTPPPRIKSEWRHLVMAPKFSKENNTLQNIISTFLMERNPIYSLYIS